MQIKYALYLSDVSIIFCGVDSDGVTEIFTHSLTEPDYIEALQRFLSKHKPESFSVFLDVMGEEFKHELIPHIGGKDRTLLLERKCKSLFSTADLTWKKHLRREKKGRKDDVYLLVGVPLSSVVEHVFDALIQTQQKVSGVYSISILEREIQSALPRAQQSLLVSRVLGVSRGKKAYRQTFIKDGELVMSRMTLINGDTVEQVFPQLLNEIERMRHFLSGTRQLGVDSRLAVLAMLNEAESAQLLQYKNDSEDINMSAVSLADVAKKKKLGRHQSFSSLAELLLVCVTVKNIKPHFHPEGLCEAHKTLNTRRWMSRCSAGLLSVSIMLAAVMGFLASGEKAKVDALQANLVQLENHKNHLAANARVTVVDPRTMKQVVDLSEHINVYQYGPDKVFGVLSRAYRGFNDISLMALSWGRAEAEPQQSRRRSRGRNNTPFMNKIKAARQFQLKVTLPAQLGNREVLRKVGDFSAALMEQPEITAVTREQAAIDTSTNAKMAASLSAGVTNKPIGFTLLITMELL
ncbi:hypothetical protein A9Q80_06280 [Cycloclasticus sp. 46_83_sub15_T18]|nr:hypothetical protein A9Q80_06280 [Cycloclasticus sp. 46_83_sub15_T18]